MEIDLQGLTSIVCGSTQGIGWATAEMMANSGARIMLIARNKEKLEGLVHQLPNQHLRHEYLDADFSEPHLLSEKLEKLPHDGDWSNILVNNTGGPKGGPANQADLEEFRIAFNAHLICNQIMLKFAMPKMVRDKFGRVINIISTSVKQPIPGLGVSNTIRGAVANWSKTIAGELGPEGITVNNVLPGATETARLESLVMSKAKKEGKSVEEVEETMKSGIPARRFGSAQEIANAILFLASREAGYINGVNLPVDGGRTSTL